MLNLATNARDAMSAGGVFTLRTRLCVLGEAGTDDLPELPPGRYAIIEVSDTGTGIAPEVQKRIFDPFFTTKDQGEGTGLGLATVHGVVHQSGGDIAVISEVDCGTTFQIFLPLTKALPTDVAEPKHTARDLGGQETILVAEDEALVANIIIKVLKNEGYQVVHAPNGVDALNLASGRDFDLLLTDIVMPRMGGFELARSLLKRRPGLPVLYMSGYTDCALAEGRAAGEPPDLIQKPFRPDDLLRRVRDTLDRALGS